MASARWPGSGCSPSTLSPERCRVGRLAGLHRLRHRLAPFENELRQLVAYAETALARVARPATAELALMVCPSFRVDDEVVHIIAVVAGFDPVGEVTLDELRIDLGYPLDDVADRFFRRSRPTPTTD
jgi:hypothetical protein